MPLKAGPAIGGRLSGSGIVGIGKSGGGNNEKNRTTDGRKFTPSLLKPLQFGIIAAGPKCYIDILVRKRRDSPARAATDHGRLPSTVPHSIISASLRSYAYSI